MANRTQAHLFATVFMAGAAFGWLAFGTAGAAGARTVCVNPQVAVEEAYSPQQGATALVVDNIDRARTSIRVAAYSFTSRMIVKALVAAKRRGVDVRVVADAEANRSHSAIPDLVADGVPTRLNGRYAIMHDKFMVIDGVTLETGSFNYTYAAEKNNAENVLVLHDQPKLTDAYIRQWQKLWDEAVAAR